MNKVNNDEHQSLQKHIEILSLPNAIICHRVFFRLLSQHPTDLTNISVGLSISIHIYYTHLHNDNLCCYFVIFDTCWHQRHWCLSQRPLTAQCTERQHRFIDQLSRGHSVSPGHSQQHLTDIHRYHRCQRFCLAQSCQVSGLVRLIEMHQYNVIWMFSMSPGCPLDDPLVARAVSCVNVNHSCCHIVYGLYHG